MNTMLAAVIHEHGKRDVIRLEQMPIPQPAPSEVRLKMYARASQSRLDLISCVLTMWTFIHNI